MYMAHCAVIFAIAQLSCFLCFLLFSCIVLFVLHCTALYCTALYCNVLCILCTVLYCSVLYGSVLCILCTALHCSVLHILSTVLYGSVLCILCTALYCVYSVLHCTVCTVLYCVLYCTELVDPEGVKGPWSTQTFYDHHGILKVRTWTYYSAEAI